MVSGLVVLLFTAVLQLGLVLHVRNTLISCASEGARLGARADAAPGMGATRARELIGASLSERYADDVSVGTGVVGGVQVVEVRAASLEDVYLDIVRRAEAGDDLGSLRSLQEVTR